eukprot:jgi/Psemu1/43124/gm1.43124_g
MYNSFCNAYHLCKLNTEIVQMHAYQPCDYLGFATSQSFGGCSCPPNWDPVAQACIQMVRYWWHHEPTETLHAATSHGHLDSTNCGVFEDGKNPVPGCPCVWIPPAMPMQVEDLFTSSAIATTRLASAASIMSLQDVFSLDHPSQEHILNASWPGLTICLLPHRCTKILSYIHHEAWLQPHKTAPTIHNIATLLGLLHNTFQHYLWGLCHILVFPGIQACFTWLHVQNQAAFVWHLCGTVAIPPTTHHSLQVLIDYVTLGGMCSTPIGHLVPWDFTFDHNTSDALLSSIGTCLPSIQVFCFLPYSVTLYARTKIPCADPPYVCINTLEFLGVHKEVGKYMDEGAVELTVGNVDKRKKAACLAVVSRAGEFVIEEVCLAGCRSAMEK